MAIRAYDELYIASAQNILGHAVDYAVNTLDIDADVFGSAFAVSDISKQFEIGNPAYVAGMNGCELARAVLDAAHLSYPDQPDEMYVDKSAQYWAGWALAYFQWASGVPFTDILKAVSLQEIIQMYPVYHEMDISQFADRMQDALARAYPLTRLQERRLNCGYSQAQLAIAADVPLRQIQLFEQRQRDINKTSAVTLYKLSKALHCRMEALFERETL